MRSPRQPPLFPDRRVRSEHPRRECAMSRCHFAVRPDIALGRRDVERDRRRACRRLERVQCVEGRAGIAVALTSDSAARWIELASTLSRRALEQRIAEARSRARRVAADDPGQAAIGVGESAPLEPVGVLETRAEPSRVSRSTDTAPSDAEASVPEVEVELRVTLDPVTHAHAEAAWAQASVRLSRVEGGVRGGCDVGVRGELGLRGKDRDGYQARAQRGRDSRDVIVRGRHGNADGASVDLSDRRGRVPIVSPGPRRGPTDLRVCAAGHLLRCRRRRRPRAPPCHDPAEAQAACALARRASMHDTRV